jgi:hypothetical protein
LHPSIATQLLVLALVLLPHDALCIRPLLPLPNCWYWRWSPSPMASFASVRQVPAAAGVGPPSSDMSHSSSQVCTLSTHPPSHTLAPAVGFNVASVIVFFVSTGSSLQPYFDAHIQGYPSRACSRASPPNSSLTSLQMAPARRAYRYEFGINAAFFPFTSFGQKAFPFPRVPPSGPSLSLSKPLYRPNKQR